MVFDGAPSVGRAPWIIRCSAFIFCNYLIAGRWSLRGRLPWGERHGLFVVVLLCFEITIAEHGLWGGAFREEGAMDYSLSCFYSLKWPNTQGMVFEGAHSVRRAPWIICCSALIFCNCLIAGHGIWGGAFREKGAMEIIGCSAFTFFNYLIAGHCIWGGAFREKGAKDYSL